MSGTQVYSRGLFSFTLIVIALGLALITGCGREAPSTTQDVVRPVQTMSVGVSPQSGGRAFPGQAEANEEAELSFRVGGSLVELSANIGDNGEEGSGAGEP